MNELQYFIYGRFLSPLRAVTAISCAAEGVQTVARPSRSGLFSNPERDALATFCFQIQSETLWLLPSANAS